MSWIAQLFVVALVGAFWVVVAWLIYGYALSLRDRLTGRTRPPAFGTREWYEQQQADKH